MNIASNILIPIFSHKPLCILISYYNYPLNHCLLSHSFCSIHGRIQKFVLGHNLQKRDQQLSFYIPPDKQQIIIKTTTDNLQYQMSITSKKITLRVPSRIIYNALKDTRLEKAFPEFFIGISKRIVNDKINREITFRTVTQDNQFEIYETFRLKISGQKKTQIDYDTKTNTDEKSIMIESILQKHIANVLYAPLMRETGYINGIVESSNKEKSEKKPR